MAAMLADFAKTSPFRQGPARLAADIAEKGPFDSLVD